MKMNLQVIKDSFVEFVRWKGLSYVDVCADNGLTYALKVLIKRDSCITKLGRNWMLLCDVLNFCANDVVRFKFGPDNRCHLYKIS
jgi:hypothetical protein